MECPYCSKLFKSERSMSGHKGFCKSGPYRADTIDRNAKAKFKLRKVRQPRGVDKRTLPASCKFCDREFENLFQKNGHQVRCEKNPNPAESSGPIGYKHTESTRKKLSDARRAFLIENPDKQFFNYRDSKAEHDLAKKFDEVGILYVRQYRGSDWKRAYKADFYLPEFNYIIEVNGEFKYENGKLHQYYLNRQRYIESFGYKVIQVHAYEVYE
ncbi:homing endonuclease protein [Rhizobium phage RHph_TM39]|uniref:Homing endonuclease protein n=1 Tax=Rhizobium phage RHph_TM30 TaxID=2509764 RepID=A0A7S5R9T2_9CAUD|nr:homing endonuclease protein [Rhizobium phage RHph_TM30]QIG71750.1 homing endonuclease protein [Rhizobium phage RHph_TM40]QIG72111.1 homing endonuclease protein [Rhizobium phage RHph_TM2_3B]QIG72473.1 homing endonuclease protein [Rhizobium phage RHph_TM3_3_6]QIG77247.1 homing endonuclease protein [Rhizobium phage RHph_TM39]QIG77863.1 homing endonuclease protein [Rhizobium phage RHph_TM61]